MTATISVSSTQPYCMCCDRRKGFRL